MKRKPKNGLNRSAYIRKLMSETEVVPATDVDYALYASEFRRLGRNLNERLKRMNTTGEIDCNEIDRIRGISISRILRTCFPSSPIRWNYGRSNSRCRTSGAR